MDVYKKKSQYDGSLDRLKLRVMVGGDLQNKELVAYTWSPTAYMRALKYFLSDSATHIGAFLQAKFKNRVFVNMDSTYAIFS